MKGKTVKILSVILCAALTMNIGLALTAGRVNASGQIQALDVGNGPHVVLSTEDLSSVMFFIRPSQRGYQIVCNDPVDDDNSEIDVTSILDLTIESSAYVCVFANVSAPVEFSGNYATLQIENTGNFSGSLSGTGDMLINYGTIRMGDFKSTDFTCNSFSSWGTVEANNVDISHFNNVYSDGNSVIKVKDSFVMGNTSLSGKVVADSTSTYIKTSGGSFTLEVNGVSKKIIGAVEGSAGSLVYEDTSVSLSSVPAAAKKIYVGQDYDFSPYIVVSPNTYTGTPYIEYNVVVPADSTDFAPDKHTTPGSYRARAVAPEVPGYWGSVSEPIDYTIEYLPIGNVSSTGNYVEVQGIANGKYVSDKVTVVPASGYQIAADMSGFQSYSDSLEFGKYDIYDYNLSARNIKFSFRDANNGARTDFHDASTLTTALNGLIFDEYDPEINSVYVYDTESNAREISIEDGDVIIGTKLDLTVYDENLDKVTIDGNTYSGESVSNGYVAPQLTINVGTQKDYTLTAVDKSGRTTEVSFTLKYPTVDASAASVTQNDVYVGDSYEPRVTTDSDGDITLYYRDNSSEDEEDYDEAQPTAAGDYTVLAVISETDFYYETSCSTTFKIKKRTPESSVYVPDTIIGEEYEPEFTSDSDGKGRVVFEYKPSNATDRSYTTTMPTAKGTYTVRATTPETDKYLSSVCTYTFKISVKPVTATVFVEDPYVGTKYTPVVTTESDGASRTTFEYKAANSIDGEYTTEQPTAAGTYIVRATVPETETYAKAVCTFQYNIKYLTAPANAYNMEGTAGNNDFFTSDVELTAPEGYKISSEFGGEYTEKIPYTEDLNVVYLMRTDDGALTSAIAIAVRPKIDKATPTFEDSTGTLTNGSAVFVKTLTLRASDDNLASLSVNGIPVDLDAEGNIMTLSPGYGIKYFKIVAEDKAGNISIIEFTLMAEWLESRIILPDIKLPLTKGEYYNLDSGRWRVTIGSGEEDTTVYNGSLPFYVSDSGDYTFTKVS